MPERIRTKGERTRRRIVAEVAPLFNQRGFLGASMADLLAATGVKAGGLYRHFRSKEALALAALDHATALHAVRYQAAVQAADGAVERIAALAAAMAGIVESPLVPGGCPLLNTAVETDDAHPPLPALRARVRQRMRGLLRFVRDIIVAGVAGGELDPTIDADEEASLMIATLEGAIMLAKLYNDPIYARRAARRIAVQARSLARCPRRPARSRQGAQ